jgi:xanthine dehydrogenase accessory factor
LEAGVSEAELARVRSPMGLELNAETPEEIAVSIMAEIIMLRAGWRWPGDGRQTFESGGESQSSEQSGEG